MIVVSAALVCLAVVAVMAPPRYRRSMRRGSGVRIADPRVVRAVAAIAGVIIAFTWGGWFGIVLGLVTAVLAPIAVGRMESKADRHRRERLAAQAAMVADLLAACLLAGAPLSRATRAVADASGAPISEPLHRLVHAIDLGADPVIAWQSLDIDALAPLGRAVARSASTGAALSPLLVGIADDLRRDERARGEAAARAAGVKAVGPLAACFLPAFVLLGVVPVVAGLAAPFLNGFS